MSSIDSGAIFLPSLGQDLSRNAFAVSVYALERNPSCRIGSVMPPKNRDFSEKVLSPSELLNLGGPAGGSAPGKVLRPQGRVPYDS